VWIQTVACTQVPPPTSVLTLSLWNGNISEAFVMVKEVIMQHAWHGIHPRCA
jgi:hypothetical protein